MKKHEKNCEDEDSLRSSMRIGISEDEIRTAEEIRDHYIVEKELAAKLRSASKEERKNLYPSLYDELYRRVPKHPQLNRKVDSDRQQESVLHQLQFLKKFLTSETIFLEVGAGDCSLAREVSRRVKRVYAIDVAVAIVEHSDCPPNCHLLLTDGCSIPLQEESITVAYSYQVMEHLHPDDARGQLRNIQRVLSSKGVYICNTPNRLNGPHDISKYFDETATGFHLKEYSLSELVDLFHEGGFRNIRIFVGIKNIFFPFPFFLIRLIEITLEAFPQGMRRWIISVRPLRFLWGSYVVGYK